VILTADHGEGLGDHGERFHGFFVYETTIHVPLIIRFPRQARAGTAIDRPVSHIDLMPTILDAVDLPQPEAVQGISLLPLILKGDGELEREVYSESFYPLLHYGWAPLRTIRNDLYKFIDVPRPELYDLRSDRQEASNLATQDPQVVDELRTRLQRLRHEMEQEAQSERAEAEIDEETLAQLRALGYMAGSGGVAVEEEGDIPRADPKDKIELHQMIMTTQTQIGRGDTEAATRTLERILESDPMIIDAHQLMGQVASMNDRFEEAVSHFQDALQLDHNHKASLYGLATAYHRLGRDEDAMVGYERLLEISPRDVKAALPLTDLYEEAGRIDDAADVLAAICEQPEPPPVLLNRLGELRVLQGRGKEGQVLFEQAIASKPELGKPYYNLAVISEEAGDIRRAVELYESAIERGPKNYQAQFNLGRLYGQMGNGERQKELWEDAIESNPDFARGYYYLAKLHMDQGDLARAEALAREGITKDPDGRGGPLGYYVLADLLNRTGRTAEAQEALAKGRAIDPRAG
jgi:tetratricopeptide (TPR) repeat protein